MKKQKVKYRTEGEGRKGASFSLSYILSLSITLPIN